jgi:hypothetical protein
MVTYSLKTITLAVGASVMLPMALSAQTIWVERTHEAALTVEAVKPFFDVSGSTTESSAVAVGLRMPVSPRILLAAELPYAHSGWQADGVTTRQHSVGNPYVGLEARPWDDRPLRLDAGVRIPLASSENPQATSLGILSDLDRVEAYAPRMWSVRGNAAYKVPMTPQVSVGMHAGPLVTIAKHREETESRAELFGVYGSEVSYQPSQLRLAAGIGGRMLITEADMSFDDRSLHQVGAAASYQFGRARPGLHLAVPLESAQRDIMNWSLGLNLQLGLR